MKAFVALFKTYGMPKAIRSDNGSPFASASAAGGLTQLSAWWARLGIKDTRSTKRLRFTRSTERPALPF